MDSISHEELIRFIKDNVANSVKKLFNKKHIKRKNIRNLISASIAEKFIKSLDITDESKAMEIGLCLIIEKELQKMDDSEIGLAD